MHYTNIATPNIYALLPLSPDHLSWHGGMQEYVSDKLKPVRMMKKGDIAIIPDGAQSFLFEGKLSTIDFNIGKFTGLEDFLGSMDMSLGVQGSFSPDKLFSSSLEGSVQHILLNNYDYHNVELSGVYSDKSFDGDISIDDPNIKLDFLGLLDFSKEIPEFDFSLNNVEDKLMLMCISSGVWHEISRASNGS